MQWRIARMLRTFQIKNTEYSMQLFSILLIFSQEHSDLLMCMRGHKWLLLEVQSHAEMFSSRAANPIPFNKSHSSKVQKFFVVY